MTLKENTYRKAFHDGYILIEFGNGQQILKREVWMLSNSLSSLAVRYPLLITPLTGDVANAVAGYLDSLWKAKLVGRTGLQSRVVWSYQRQSKHFLDTFHGFGFESASDFALSWCDRCTNRTR